MSDHESRRLCPHCGALGQRCLGFCTVCNTAVCEHCGNVQYAGGKQEPIHNECLHRANDSFSMIKFVK